MLQYFHKYPIQTGIAFGAVNAYLFLKLHASQTILIVLLALIAGIYTGFAVQDGRPRIIFIESAVSFAFLIYSTALLDKSLYPAFFVGLNTKTLLALGFVAHGVWDYLHHSDHGGKRKAHTVSGTTSIIATT
eukprot:Phypoly_transcript_20485.p1 GENE.Phypoly_transcript_20485~~Phypoly_transcript_20485.p1  ORF type:complete len:132 (+),score=8.80 Phypoly_transcript_20485:138-533(+)